MAITNFMNLDLPTVSVTLGPEWASDLNAALEVVDSHDHTSGKGVRIPTAGLNINANLDFNEFKAYDLFSAQLKSQTVPLTGASNANSVSVSSGNLYFTNGSGTAIQLTSGGAPITTPGQVQTLEFLTVNGDLTIGSSDTTVFLSVDTTSSRTITLPLAAAVATGRIYAIKDATGNSNANPMTVATQGGDLLDDATSQVIDSDYGCIWVISNGANGYSIL